MRRGSGVTIEALETRSLLSAALHPTSLLPTALDRTNFQQKISAIDALHLPATARSQPNLTRAAGISTPQTSAPNPIGLSPTQLRNFYGINSITFNGVTGDGRGQTIAIVDAFDDPDISSDLAAFDAAYHLPAPPSFTKVSQTGSKTHLPLPPTPDPYEGSWSAEVSLDVEWSHAIAPGANILLVEANDDSDLNLFTAAAYAASVPAVSVVTMSFGDPETDLSLSDVQTFDKALTTPPGHQGVTFFASSGDNGAFADGGDLGVAYPSSSPNVIAVGGTTITKSSTSALSGETAWTDSGGGISMFEPQSPAQQNAVGGAPNRLVPDVAFDADPASGVNLADSFDFGSADRWAVFGGTSLSSPSWAGLAAIVNQGLTAAGSPVINGTPAMASLLYSRPASEFNDITTGNNQNYYAGPGYDLVTGLGTPIANKLVPDLAQAGITPVLNTLSASVSSEPSATSFTLTASKFTDSASAIASVSFYRESDGVSGLQTGAAGDLLLGTGVSDGHGDWTITVKTTGLASGQYTYYAVATDGRGSSSAPAKILNTITSLKTPVIHTLTPAPASENEGTAFTLTAGASETNGTISKVEFYRESNQIAGLQAGVGGDTLLATDTTPSNGFSASISTTGLDPGTYAYYAVAFDSQGVGSAGVQTSNTVLPLKMVGSLTASKSHELAGTSFNLTAGQVAEAGRTIAQVQFYRQSNSASRPQPAVDMLLGAGVKSATGTWTIAVNTAALGPGTYVYYAVATDSAGLRSSPTTASNTISRMPPVIGSFVVNPTSETAGSTITLTASNLTSPNFGATIASVMFYRETDAIAGLQSGSGGDQWLGAATRNPAGSWNLTVGTDGMSTGAYTYYVVVTDNYGGSTVGTAKNSIIAPPNDNFANAQVLTGTSATVSGSNENATRENGEPEPAGNLGGASVWYAWTAPDTGQVNIQTSNSTFIALLAVYIGTSVSKLTSVASNDGIDSFNGDAGVSFKAHAGITYRIDVDGFNDDDGTGPSEGEFALSLLMPAFSPAG